MAEQTLYALRARAGLANEQRQYADACSPLTHRVAQELVEEHRALPVEKGGVHPIRMRKASGQHCHL